jgi:amidase
MPAAFSGVYGFKPSHGRTSMKGAAGSVSDQRFPSFTLLKVLQGKGQVVIPTIAGIMGPQLSTIHLVFKSLLATEPWLYDPDVLPIPYRSEAEHRSDQKASFAIFDSDGIVAPHPPIARALRMVREALKAESHKVIISPITNVTASANHAYGS